MSKAPWITYLPELKVLDCTIRDGGLINDHAFDDKFVRAVYDTCVEAGIDYMEIGYKASKTQFAAGKYGHWKFCDEDHVRRIVGAEPAPEPRLSCMIDAGKTDWRTDVLPREKSVISMMRVACYVHQIAEAVEMIKDAHDKGYETTCNIMAISTVKEVEIDQALEIVAKSPIDVVVVVDSYGSLYGIQVEGLVKKYKKALAGTGKEVGVHMHNNQQLAFANTIEAIINGATRLDATMGGMGRGAGNCPMELLLGLLRNPKFKIRPVWKLLQDHFLELQKTLEWGPYPPYMITGQSNQHPRAAIAWRACDQKENCVDFYDKCMAEL